MQLRDMYEPDEIPTRPDHPKACATKCRHCGQVFGDHVMSVPPLPPRGMFDAPCFGLRGNFDGEERRDADRER